MHIEYPGVTPPSPGISWGHTPFPRNIPGSYPLPQEYPGVTPPSPGISWGHTPFPRNILGIISSSPGISWDHTSSQEYPGITPPSPGISAGISQAFPIMKSVVCRKTWCRFMCVSLQHRSRKSGLKE